MNFFRNKILRSASDGVSDVFKIVFSFLLIAYASKSSGISFSGIDSVVLIWSLFLLFVFVNIHKKSVFISLFIYIFLACFYVLGELRISNGYQSGGYLRVLLTFFILTSMVAIQLGLDSSKVAISKLNIFFTVEICIFVLITYWIIFIAKAQNAVDYAVREYGADNYLTLSDIMALLGLSVISDHQKKIIFKILWLIVVLVAMMMLGSRASVLVFAVAALLSISIVNKNNVNKIKLKILFFALLAMFLLVYLFFEFFNDTVTYRMRTLLDISNDESAAGRKFLLNNYFSTISVDPSCLIIPCPPLAGDYAHNLFSIIQYFGIAGIGLLVCIVTLLFWAFLKGWRPLLPAILVYSLIQLIFFRSWSSMVFSIVIAYCIAAMLYVFRKKSYLN